MKVVYSDPNKRVDLNRFYRDISLVLSELREFRSSASGDQRITRNMILELISATRSMRQMYLGTDLFADPAWDMLLELKRAEVEQVTVGITKLCALSGVPETTAHRWISLLTNKGMLVRTNDPFDRRKTFVSLHPDTSAAIDAFLDAAIQQMESRRIGLH